MEGYASRKNNISTGINAETDTGTDTPHAPMFLEAKRWAGSVRKGGRTRGLNQMVSSARARILPWSFRELINDTPAPRLNF